ncbi:MAG: DUF2188 domain-containing protein [Candidatus Eremiobacteraeota bacterium]|nr:DUF2188 domain-containing protein [Candidatus Eremiobacteraeota bacterium]
MANVPDIRAASISISKTSLVVELQDGRTLTVPLSWFPDLVAADGEQLADHRLIGDGLGIHWETLGVDLSVSGLLFDSPPPSGPKERRRVTYHVVPAGGDGWHLKRQGEQNFTSFETKEEAIKAGVREARTHEAGQLIIHTRDGRFEEERTYGYDPPGRPG